MNTSGRERMTLLLPAILLLLPGGCAGRGGKRDPGLTPEGGLAPCPRSPNCVSTQAEDAAHRVEPLPFQGSPEGAMERIVAILEEMPRTKIVTREGNYLHATVTSRFFRFVDDLEVLIDPVSREIHFRSASRTGYSDMGVNRRRVEAIKTRFAATSQGKA